jgi:hypothetical protein
MIKSLQSLLARLKKPSGMNLRGSFRTPEEADADVRRALAEHGDDGASPRHTLFYFYGGDQGALRKAALAAGYSVRPTAQDDGSVLETTMSVDKESLSPVEIQMRAWAESCGAEYDGWECAVVSN